MLRLQKLHYISGAEKTIHVLLMLTKRSMNYSYLKFIKKIMWMKVWGRWFPPFAISRAKLWTWPAEDIRPNTRPLVMAPQQWLGLGRSRPGVVWKFKLFQRVLWDSEQPSGVYIFQWWTMSLKIYKVLCLITKEQKNKK